MKKICLSLSVVSLIGSIFWSCSQQNKEQTQATQPDSVVTTMQDTTAQTGNYVDPNQASELALLMRGMFTDSEAMKQAVLAGTMPQDLRTKFSKIHTAIPTEADIKDETFKAMAKVFLNNMDNLYDTKNQVEDFNILVQSCLACHQNYCPGPIVRIKKLVIETPQSK